GAITHDEVVDGVARRLAGVDGGESPARVAPVAAPRRLEVLKRRVEQAHLAIGVRGLPKRDPDRFALAAANVAFGGGMSSRLFQTIREERGLAYSVYSYPASYSDCGAFVVYAGTTIAPRRGARHHPGRARPAARGRHHGVGAAGGEGLPRR